MALPFTNVDGAVLILSAAAVPALIVCTSTVPQ